MVIAKIVEDVLSLSDTKKERIQSAARATAESHDIFIQAEKVKRIYTQLINARN